jgi:hypothetical protein
MRRQAKQSRVRRSALLPGLCLEGSCGLLETAGLELPAVQGMRLAGPGERRPGVEGDGRRPAPPPCLCCTTHDPLHAAALPLPPLRRRRGGRRRRAGSAAAAPRAGLRRERGHQGRGDHGAAEKGELPLKSCIVLHVGRLSLLVLRAAGGDPCAPQAPRPLGAALAAGAPSVHSFCALLILVLSCLSGGRPGKGERPAAHRVQGTHRRVPVRERGPSCSSSENPETVGSQGAHRRLPVQHRGRPNRSQDCAPGRSPWSPTNSPFRFLSVSPAARPATCCSATAWT